MIQHENHRQYCLDDSINFSKNIPRAILSGSEAGSILSSSSSENPSVKKSKLDKKINKSKIFNIIKTLRRFPGGILCVRKSLYFFFFFFLKMRNERLSSERK